MGFRRALDGFHGPRTLTGEREKHLLLLSKRLTRALLAFLIGTAAIGCSGPQERHEGIEAKQMGSADNPWMGPQEWTKETDGPVLALGDTGAFDDMHIFAPCVAYEDGAFFMLYPGSQGAVGERVFRLGLATSKDGVHFEKSPLSPVFEYGDGGHSVLTPTLLRNPDGSLLRENGRLRMWFSAVDLGDGIHKLYETSGTDLTSWSPPSPAQLTHVYAPTITKERGTYRMWYTDVSREDTWVYRHAQSRDGKTWEVSPDPVLVVDQEWEQSRLFYPFVLKSDELYVLWYASYWSAFPQKTAIGCAVSRDGLVWEKNPHNPVLRPDPELPWESHYNSSHYVLRLKDGGWRIWYGSREKPPFVHKYFAICTARWSGF